MKNIIKKLKEKRGSNVIEFTISLLIFVILFAFFVDIFSIAWKFIVTSQVANETVKTICVQSGVLTQTPKGFPGDSQYVTSPKLYSNIQKLLKDKANIDKFTLKLNGYDKNGGGTTSTILSPTTNFKVDYKGRVEVQLSVNYQWGLSKTLPGLSSEKMITAKRSGLTEFKYDYDKWIGEE